MPSLVLSTNVQINDVKAFVLEFSKFGAQVLGKPESYISIKYDYNEFLTFGGTFEPAFLCVITSLDNINPGLNAKYSTNFFQFFKEKLGVPSDRGYITFNDPGRAYMGYKDTTFATIFSK